MLKNTNKKILIFFSYLWFFLPLSLYAEVPPLFVGTYISVDNKTEITLSDSGISHLILLGRKIDTKEVMYTIERNDYSVYPYISLRYQYEINYIIRMNAFISENSDETKSIIGYIMQEKINDDETVSILSVVRINLTKK